MHSFRFIGASQGVFVFWIVRDFLLLQKGCDRIVIELEPRLHPADLLINAVVVRVELCRQFEFLKGVRIFLLGRRSCSQSKMGVSTLWIQPEQLRKAFSRQLWTILSQASHTKGEVRPFVLGVQLNDALQLTFDAREVALDPISARQPVVRGQVLWSLPDRSMQLRNGLLGLVFG